MKKRRLFTLLAGAGLALILAAVPLMNACAPASPKQVELEILAGPVNSFMGVATAEILNKNHPWIRASVTETTSSSATIVLGSEKDPKQVLLIPAEEAYIMAKAGLLTARPGYTFPDFRWIGGWSIAGVTFVTLDPDIRTLADLEGKRIAVLEESDADTVIIKEIFDIMGIGDTIKYVYMGFPVVLEPLKDGLVDAALGWGELYQGGWGPLFFLEEVIALKGEKLHPISLDISLLEQAYENTGLKFGTTTLPPGAYGPGHTEPADALTMVAMAIAAFAGADEEVIYEVTKMMAEHTGEFGDYYPAAGAVTPETMFSNIPTRNESEIHPGALRYYKEIGLTFAPGR